MNARPVSFLLAVALAACGDEETERAPAPPTFAEVEAILDVRCTKACHSGGEFAAGGLDLQHNAYDVLVGPPPTGVPCAGGEMGRVVPGSPEESLLYVKIAAKLDDTPAPCGDVMPPGANAAPLDPEEVELIRAWIAGGAPRD